MGAGKVEEICPATRSADAKGERMCSSYSFLTSALDGVSDHPPSPATRYPGERTPVRTGSRVGLRAGLIKQARGKILCLCWRFKLYSSL
jgi:hypothetical protein